MTAPQRAATSPRAPTASLRDTLRVLATVQLPLVARGVVARRPRLVGALDRVDADARAVATLRAVRRRYGPGPLLLRLPGRTLGLVLTGDHVRRVLSETPEPFHPATLEKRGALSHFQPHGVLVSDRWRAERRRFNEAVLDSGQPVHQMAPRIVDKVRAEGDALAAEAAVAGRVRWDDFVVRWWRAVRRVVLGEAARDDHALTDMLTRLRHDANWSYLRPRRTGLRARFDRQLRWHLDRNEADSLAHLVRSLPQRDETAPAQQIPQWLFAFDPAGMATWRALALLSGHPSELATARREATDGDPSLPRLLPHLRGSVLESLRLWPTTPAILRDTTTATRWDGATVPSGTGLMVFAPLFHRDEESVDAAHGFAPNRWREDPGRSAWPLVPFSDGPGVCPGRNLVLLVASTMLAVLLERLEVRLEQPVLDASAALPATLSPYRLSFAAAQAPR